jgi:hypothetical protein
VKISLAFGIAGALGAGCSARLMIGGGGSTAYRAAADVIGAEAVVGDAAKDLAGVDAGAGAGRGPEDATGRTGLGNGRPEAATLVIGRAGVAVGRGWLSAFSVPAEAVPGSPRKSPTRFSTNWLIEIPLVSQNDLSFS